MRTQIANRWILPPSIFRLHFDSYTPSPFCAGWRWGLLSRKIFFDFYFSDSLVFTECLDWEYFEFYTRYSYLGKIFFIFRDFVLEFYFFQNPNFNSLSFARYSSSDFSLCIISYWFSLWILIFSFTLRFMASIIIMDSMFFDSIFRLVFTRVNFDLFQHCRFYALTLRLFISSACYKQTSMLMWV